jgi:hypothetical protein
MLLPVCLLLRFVAVLLRRLAGSQSRSGRFGKEKNLLPLSGFEPRTCQSTTESIPITLSRLRFFDKMYIGQILRRNCLLRQVIEEKIEGGIEVTG